MTADPTTAARITTAPRARRIRPSNQYWDFRTLRWEVAPPRVPVPRAGE